MHNKYSDIFSLSDLRVLFGSRLPSVPVSRMLVDEFDVAFSPTQRVWLICSGESLIRTNLLAEKMKQRNELQLEIEQLNQ